MTCWASQKRGHWSAHTTLRWMLSVGSSLDLNKMLVRFYSTLFSNERCSGAPRAYFQGMRNKADPLRELQETLQGMKNGWVPGIHGLHKAFHAAIGQNVLKVLQESVKELQEERPEPAGEKGRLDIPEGLVSSLTA